MSEEEPLEVKMKGMDEKSPNEEGQHSTNSMGCWASFVGFLTSHPKFFKWTFIFCNIILMVFGIASLVVGVYYTDEAEHIKTLNDDSNPPRVAKLLIACGVLVILTIFFRICVLIMWKGFENCCKNKVIKILSIFLFALIFFLGIAAWVLACTTNRNLYNFKTLVNKKYGLATKIENQKEIDDAVDWIQENEKCCGYDMDSFAEWGNSEWKISKHGKGFNKSLLAPKSCCKDEHLAKCNEDTDNLWDKGCQPKIEPLKTLIITLTVVIGILTTLVAIVDAGCGLILHNCHK